MAVTIKFGTDGWRALIARDFTFDSVSLCARAVGEVIKERKPDRPGMFVGYDRRFLSRQFAEAVASVYAQQGFDVQFAENFVPTPLVAWSAKIDPTLSGATVITSSHNPAEWNGFKFKETFGGSARPALTKLFEERIEKLEGKCYAAPSPEAFEGYLKSGKIRLTYPMEPYFEAVRKHVDGGRIADFKPRIALDVMHGAAGTLYARLLNSFGVAVEELNAEDNPGFRGVSPEPIGRNLRELCETVRKNGYICGLATDGDADRLGAVDENGEPFTTQMILSVIYRHMLAERKKLWNICRSASTTFMVDLLAKRAGVKCLETPVGFKHIAEKMVAGEAHIGGEESGGVGLLDHIPDRDGLLTGLLLLEIVATHGKGLRAVYEDLCREERPYYFVRNDIHLSNAAADKAWSRLEQAAPQSWKGRPVETLSRIDGFKFYLKDGAWILIRKSGTEPIYRLYAEAETLGAAEALVAAAKTHVETA